MRGPDALLRDSYAALTAIMASGLDLRLRSVVTAIDYSDWPARVYTRDAAFSAEHVLVTVPLGVLQAGSIEFNPPLQASHQAAIDGLGMGLTNKLFLRFPRAFWDPAIEIIGYQNRDRGRWPSWYNYQPACGEPVLLGFTTGRAAVAVEALSDTETLNDAMSLLRVIYGAHIPEPEAALITRWGQDPFSRGAYSFLPVRARSKLRRALAKPLAGRLHFAGEATDNCYPATTQGAYRSGLRAASQILAGAQFEPPA